MKCNYALLYVQCKLVLLSLNGYDFLKTEMGNFNTKSAEENVTFTGAPHGLNTSNQSLSKIFFKGLRAKDLPLDRHF